MERRKLFTAIAGGVAAAVGVPLLLGNKAKAQSSGFVGAPPNAWNGGFAAGRYYIPGTNVNPTNTGTIVLSADVLYGGPGFVVYEPILWTRLAVGITSGAAAGKLIRLGIYNVRNGVPSSLVLDAGTIAADGTGVIEATISQVLPPGTYMTALVTDGTPTVRAVGNNANFVNVLGYTALGSGTADSASVIRTAAFSFAALPSTFGAITYQTPNCPTIALRTGV